MHGYYSCLACELLGMTAFVDECVLWSCTLFGRPRESERERERERERNTEKDKQLQAAMWEMRETDRVAETEREREISSGPVPSELRAQHP